MALNFPMLVLAGALLFSSDPDRYLIFSLRESEVAKPEMSLDAKMNTPWQEGKRKDSQSQQADGEKKIAIGVSPMDVQVRRIEAALLIGDDKGALQEARRAYREYPQAFAVKRCYLEALAHAGQEREMLKVWREACTDEEERYSLSESVAWGVLYKAVDSSTLISRVYALIGAVLTQDAKAVGLLRRALQDSNAHIRQIAIQLSVFLRDPPLQKALLRLAVEDNNFTVRLAAIEAMGEMRLKDARPFLKALLENSRASLEEKLLAAEAMGNMIGDVSLEELAMMAKSNRAGLRLLACQLIAAFQREDAADFLPALLEDARSEVRAAAVTACGLIHSPALIESMQDRLCDCLQDSDMGVSTLAAWCLMQTPKALAGKTRAEAFLLQRLIDKSEKVRCSAAAALASSGPHGWHLLDKAYDQAFDPLVRANLAMGWIFQRTEMEKACNALHVALSDDRPLMWEKKGPFQILQPSTLRHQDMIPALPESADLITRLELLHLLTVLNDAEAKEILRLFLSEKRWGGTGPATALMLQEGDAADAHLLTELLEDENETAEVRTEAALTMAVWTRDPLALETLMRMYPQVDAETKIKILEALGAIGDKNALPFLQERLFEPFQTLRVVAASSLIRCLNH